MSHTFRFLKPHLKVIKYRGKFLFPRCVTVIYGFNMQGDKGHNEKKIILQDGFFFFFISSFQSKFPEKKRKFCKSSRRKRG